jgi:hypothetical protein
MGEVNPEEQLEIGPGVFKRLGDCTGSEIGQPADDLSDAALTLLVPFKPQATASRSGRRACQRGPNINRRRPRVVLDVDDSQRSLGRGGSPRRPDYHRRCPRSWLHDHHT